MSVYIDSKRLTKADESETLMTVEPTDGELLMRFLQHQDDAAFELLVQRHQSSVYAVCQSVLGNRHDAEDAFQATFLVLARKAKSLQFTPSIGGWLFRVALRTAKNAQMKNWRAKETELKTMEHNSARDPLTIIQERELLTTLYDELGKLPEKYRAPVVLCVLEGKSRTQASTELDCTVASVKARLARGKQQLRVELTRRGIAFSVALAAAHSTVRVAEASFETLSSNTASACSSYSFSVDRSVVPSEIVQLSERGLSTMTIATCSKVAIASLVVLLVGIGGTAIPILGNRHVHGADEAATISSNAFSPNVSSTAEGAFSLAQLSTSPTKSNDSGVSPADEMRLHTSPQVSEQTSESVFSALIEALGDNKAEVRYAAARTLTSIGSDRREVIAALANIVQKSKDKTLRNYAISGLGRIGRNDLNAANTLSSVLKNDTDAHLRLAAVEALGKMPIGDDVALSLVATLNDSDVKVRVAAASELSKLNPGKTPNLLSRISVPEELSIRVGHSEFVENAEQFLRVLVDDPSVAVVTPTSPTIVQISGKAKGSTTVNAWDSNGQLSRILVTVSDGKE